MEGIEEVGRMRANLRFFTNKALLIVSWLARGVFDDLDSRGCCVGKGAAVKSGLPEARRVGDGRGL